MMKPANTSASEVLKYLVTGGMNAVLTCIVYVVGLYVLHIHYLVALAAAFLVGVLFTYVVNFVWVFRPDSRFTFRRRFIRYFTSNAATFLANVVALYCLVDVFGSDPFLSQVLLMVVIIVANFLLAKHWSLRKTPRGRS